MASAAEYTARRNERIVIARFGALHDRFMEAMPAVIKQIVEQPDFPPHELVEFMLSYIELCGRGDINITNLRR
jgi:hypothetical protein